MPVETSSTASQVVAETAETVSGDILLQDGYRCPGTNLTYAAGQTVVAPERADRPVIRMTQSA